jgi:hypothetical protein
MDLPAGIDVHESDLDLFQQYVHPAFEVERLILVANQFGGSKISVYAMGHLKAGKTVADIAPTRANIIEGLIPATQPSNTNATAGGTTTQPSPAPAAATATQSIAPAAAPAAAAAAAPAAAAANATTADRRP